MLCPIVTVDRLYVLILLLSVVITRWDTVTITYVRNLKLEFLEIDWIKSDFYLLNYFPLKERFVTSNN